MINISSYVITKQGSRKPQFKQGVFISTATPLSINDSQNFIFEPFSPKSVEN